MNRSESGVYKHSIRESRHAPDMEDNISPDINYNTRDYPAPIMGHVVLKGALGGLLPGRIVSDEEAKGVDPSSIASHIPHDGRSWVAVEYDRDWTDVIVAVASHDNNRKSEITFRWPNGLNAIGKLPVRWCQVIEVDADGY